MIKIGILGRIYFYKTEDGGKKIPVENMFGCPAYIDGKYYDCRLHLENNDVIYPGETKDVNISFLSKEKVLSSLKIGSEFKLWEGRFIADVEVLDICS